MDEQLFRSGAALLERVRDEVDTAEGLARIHGRRRRSRVLRTVAVAAAVLVGFVAVAGALRSEDPVASERAHQLPATVYYAELDDFVADAAGSCAARDGAVVLGTGFNLRDRAGRLLAAGVVTNRGEVVSRQRAVAIGLPADGDVCLLELLAFEVSATTLRYATLELGGRPWPPRDVYEAGRSEVGRQFVFYTRGSQP